MTCGRSRVEVWLYLPTFILQTARQMGQMGLMKSNKIHPTQLNFTAIYKSKWNWRKLWFWTLYLLVALFLLFIQVKVHNWMQYLVSAMRAQIIPLLVLLFSFEPVFILSLTLFTSYSSPLTKDTRTLEQKRAENRSIAFVIVCHYSSDVIETTINACLQHVSPHQIFVCDNGNSMTPLDQTKDILEMKYPPVEYLWNPYGNKTLAQYAGVLAARDFEHIVIIDDDVTVPANMSFGLNHFHENENVKAVCYPIRPVHPERKDSLFIDWQAIEYKMTDYAKLLQAKYSTVLFPHGTIAMWDRSMLLQVLRSHDTVFYAEDVKMGMWLQRQGYEMRIESSVLVDTDAPTSICGAAPNYYCQRVRSWDMAEHVYAGETLSLFFTTSHSTILGTIIMKVFQFYSLFCILSDWIRLPVVFLGFYISWSLMLIKMGLVLVTSTLMILLWNLIGYRNHVAMRSNFFPLLTFQLYKILTMVIRFLGLCRAGAIYLPNFKPKPKIQEIEMIVYKQTQKSRDVVVLDISGDDEASEVQGMPTPIWLTNDARFKYYKDEFNFEMKRICKSKPEEDTKVTWTSAASLVALKN